VGRKEWRSAQSPSAYRRHPRLHNLESPPDDLGARFTIERGPSIDKLGDEVVFLRRFDESVEVEVEVVLRLIVLPEGRVGHAGR
jgi:hypothetical protein